MKKISTNKVRRSGSPRILPWLPLLSALLFSGCAFTEYGNRINQEQLDIVRLEDKRHSLETQYIIVLNSLESHPTEDKLIKERDEVRGKLIDVSSQIVEKRKLLDQSYREWEQKIVEEKIQQQMIDNEVKENADKNEDEDFNNQ
jgi:hypothetical protein